MDHEQHAHHHEHMDHPDPEAADYWKFAGILVFIFTASYSFFVASDFNGWMGYMVSFMGVFFVVFAFFKLLDIRNFAYSFAGYNPIARRWLGWGFVYPFLELALGIGYLAGFALTQLNIIVLVVTTIGATGILRQLLRGSKIKCACLGKYINLPLSTVSLVEDVSMAVMATVMLIF